MANNAADYLRELTDRFGRGWNRFWFTPADPFTLGVLRIGTGIVALLVQLSYSFDLARLFADDGWLPIGTVVALESGNYRFSILDAVHDPTGLMVIHWLSALLLLSFTVGLWTRITSILATLVMLSYVHRAPLLTSQVEPVLTMLMIYLCLGPAGTALSIDRALYLRKAKARGALIAAVRPSIAANISLRLIQVHLSLLYAMMGLCKLLGDSWWLGTGVWYLAARPDSRLVDLTFLANYPLIVNAWSHAIVVFELAFAIVIWVAIARPLLLAIGIVMWSSLALLTGNIAWSAVMIVANFSFASPAWLRSWTPSARTGSPSPPSNIRVAHSRESQGAI